MFEDAHPNPLQNAWAIFWKEKEEGRQDWEELL